MRLLSWIDEVVESVALGPEANLAMTVSVTGGISIGSRSSLSYSKLVRTFKLDTEGRSCFGDQQQQAASICAGGAPDGVKRRVLLLGALLRPLRDMHRRQRWDYSRILSSESTMTKVLSITEEAVAEVEKHTRGAGGEVDRDGEQHCRRKLIQCVLGTDVPRSIVQKVVPSLEGALRHCASVQGQPTNDSGPQLKSPLQVIPLRAVPIKITAGDTTPYFHPDCVYLTVLDRFGLPLTASPADTENRRFSILASVELGATWLRSEGDKDEDDEAAAGGGGDARDSSDDSDAPSERGGSGGKDTYVVEGRATSLLVEQEMLQQMEMYFQELERLEVRVLFSVCRLPESVVFVGQRHRLTILWIDQEDAERVEVGFRVRPITIGSSGATPVVPTDSVRHYKKLSLYDGGKGLLLQRGGGLVRSSSTCSPFGVVFAVDASADSAASLAKAMRKAIVACAGDKVTYVAGAGTLESAIARRLRAEQENDQKKRSSTRAQQLEKLVLQSLEDGLVHCASLATGGDPGNSILRESKFASAIGVGLEEDKMVCLDRAETILEAIQVVLPIGARLCNLDDAAYR